MPFAVRSVLIPIDFDDSAPAALDMVKQVLQTLEGAPATVHLVHVLAILLAPGEPTAHVSMQVDDAEKALKRLAEEHLGGIKHQILTRTGDTAKRIVEAARAVQADLIIMPTHGRHGLPHFFLGSVAERVVRDASCPVLTFKPKGLNPQQKVVEEVMLKEPPTVGPSHTLDQVHQAMEESGLRSIPVMEGDRLVGIITDRDLRLHSGHLQERRVNLAMSSGPVSVAPTMALSEAAQLLVKLKVGALPVLEGGKLVGMVSTDEVIQALVSGPASG